jgi:acyl-CoA dehydrogenase
MNKNTNVLESLESSENERSVVAGLLQFAESESIPLEESLGPTFEDPRLRYSPSGKEVPEVTAARRSIRMRSAEAGYYSMFCPADMGGAELGEATSFLSWEALHHRYGPGERLVYSSIAHWTSGPSKIWRAASERLQSEVLPSLMSGSLQGSFGMSEPDAGSDAWRMKTSARRQGDDWILNGSKQWTSYSPTADFVLTFAVTDPALVESRKGGITCFYVPTESEGFSVDGIIRLFGEIGGREGILSFSDVVVSDANRLGEVDRGFEIAMAGATQGRIYNTARSVGLSRWALERSVEYAKIRWASGKPIAEHQSIQNILADMAVDIYAAKTMGIDCARKAQAGEDIRRDAAMAKLFATNAATRSFDRAMQVHGGMGLTNEMRFYEGWKTARTIRIADGTDEILRRTIARELLKGDVGF